MKPKPDVTAFLDGGEASRAVGSRGQPALNAKLPPGSGPETATFMIEVVKPEPTVQKLFRLRWDVAQALRAAALRESNAEGRRVTETEIVERMLREKYMTNT